MKYFLTTFLFVLTFNSAIADLGNGAGGGTDTPKDPTAWFIGPTKTIQSCVYIDPKFGVGRETAIKEIYSVYQTWQNYIEKKNLAWDLGSVPVMSTKIQVNEKCTGTEDLTFYFGTEDEQVKKAKQSHNKPFGIAERLQYDFENSWSKGFIWIANQGSISNSRATVVPDWTLPYTLHGILLHEVGHTLGNEHVPGTVMYSDLGYVIGAQTKEGLYNFFLNQIDSGHELHFCRKCGYTFVQTDSNGPVQGGLSASMLELTGHAVVGKPRAEFSFQIGAGKLPSGRITYEDDKNKYTFLLSSIARVCITGGITRPFQATVKSGPGTWTVTSGDTSSYIFTAILEGLGKKRSVILNRNAAGRAEIVDARTGKQLFWSYEEK